MAIPLRASPTPSNNCYVWMQPFPVSPLEGSAVEPAWRLHGAVQPIICMSLPVDGMTMNIGLLGIGLTGLAGPGGGFSGRPERSAVKYFRLAFVWVLAVVIAGLGVRMLLSGHAGNSAESEPVQLATAGVTEPVSSTVPATTVAQDGSSFNPATAEAIAPVETAAVDGLTISSQSWRRGGLGSNALITLTLRNANDFAVKDIELFCSFTRRDGSHLTDRTRVIHDVVDMKSRKTFARMHVGFVNINADRAKCSLVAASHI
jgi:hypothetical protein